MDMQLRCVRSDSTPERERQVWWGDKCHTPIKAISYYNSSHTRIELQAAAARGMDCCWAAGSCSVVLCAKKGKETRTLYEQKNPVCIHTLRAYTGIGDAQTQSPGMLRKPGDLPQVCPRPKMLKKACHERHTARIAPKPPAT